MDKVIKTLLNSKDPCIRYRTLVDVCGLSASTQQAIKLQELIPGSERVAKLLSPLGTSPLGTSPSGAGGQPQGVYSKFTGAHWVLADLADIGYPAVDGHPHADGHPPGDHKLDTLRDQVYGFWLSPERTRERVIEREAARYKSRPGVPIIDGRARRCASQEGNALYASIALGLINEHTNQLASNLIRWQWPDGGWNCDRKTSAKTSSFHESLLPLRGLVWHTRLTGSEESKKAVEECSEFFLQRNLFRRKSDGSIIREDFLKLRYPHYWHYDILIALKVMVEAGRITDPRCEEALDILESRQLPDGGWRAEGKHYRVVEEPANGGSMVEWGKVSRMKEMNEFVTLDVLYVLRETGRISIDSNEIQDETQ